MILFASVGGDPYTCGLLIIGVSHTAVSAVSICEIVSVGAALCSTTGAGCRFGASSAAEIVDVDRRRIFSGGFCGNRGICGSFVIGGGFVAFDGVVFCLRGYGSLIACGDVLCLSTSAEG